MKEELQRTPKEGKAYGTVRGADGTVVARDIIIVESDGVYVLTAGVPAYIDEIKRRNERIADPDLKEDDNIFPVTPDNLKEGKLFHALGDVPNDILRPYMRKQDWDPLDDK